MTAASVEAQVLLRILSAVLREDVLGLRTRGELVQLADGLWLRTPAGVGEALLFPVRPDGFQCEIAVRRPLARRHPHGTDLTTADAVVAELRRLADPVDRPGFDAWAAEIRAEIAARDLHRRTHDAVMAALADGGADLMARRGVAGMMTFEALAARHPHPVYPTSFSRIGLTEEQLRAYGPECMPRFRLRWLAVGPRMLTQTSLTTVSVGRSWWPTTDGLPETTKGRVTFPVHPLTVGPPLDAALTTTGLAGDAELVEQPHTDVAPTLSMRTVAILDDPTVHLKLPLPTATLGLRNRRDMRPSTLVDGLAGQRLLQRVIAREPRFGDRVLLTDDSCFGHLGHELLAVMLRRYPAGLDDATVVPLAALLAPAPGGRLVADQLADRYFGGDLLALFDGLLRVLFDWHVTLFTYGVAVESHQQNLVFVLDDQDDGTRVRLLIRDHDGPRVHLDRLRVALDEPSLDPGFADHRIVVAGDQPLLDMFATITVHLCAGACAFELARLGRARLADLLALVRDRLASAIHRAGPAATPLAAGLLHARRLPIKAMLSAGSLFAKERSGAEDINKHYTSGPNYLLESERS